MTLQEVNPAVNLLLPDAFFERLPNGMLYLMRPDCKYYPKVRWRFRSDRLWPFDRKACSVSGGTVVTSLCQMALWLLDYPRRPIKCWRYITSQQVWGDKPTGKQLYEYLESSSYNDPKRTKCVRCGAPEPTDWWTLDDLIGPCCSWGKCEAKSV